MQTETLLHDVFLYGHLAEKYGDKHRFAINSAPEAVRALAANYPSFYNDFKDGHYQVIIGDRETGTQLDQSMGRLRMGKDKPVHIIPVVGGSKGGGGVKIIAGLALLMPFAWEFGALYFGAAGELGASVGEMAEVAATTSFSVGGFNISYGALAAMGLSLILGGVSQILNRPPQVSTQSFLFNGAVNQTRQGTPVPIVYGRIQVGSILVSVGMNAVQLL